MGAQGGTNVDVELSPANAGMAPSSANRLCAVEQSRRPQLPPDGIRLREQPACPGRGPRPGPGRGAAEVRGWARWSARAAATSQGVSPNSSTALRARLRARLPGAHRWARPAAAPVPPTMPPPAHAARSRSAAPAGGSVRRDPERARPATGGRGGLAAQRGERDPCRIHLLKHLLQMTRLLARNRGSVSCRLAPLLRTPRHAHPGGRPRSPRGCRTRARLRRWHSSTGTVTAFNQRLGHPLRGGSRVPSTKGLQC